jgi:hypothetical protein
MKFFPFATLAVALSTIALPRPAAATQKEIVAARAGAERPSNGLHVDVESDPTAFVFGGYSLHLGLGYRHLRLDLGGYAMDVPSFVEPNAGFDASFRGVGTKLQLFLFDEQTGGFVGVDAGISQLRVEETASGERQSQLQVGYGVNFGWRFPLPFGLHATPWLGISYTPNARDLHFARKTYEPNSVLVFPAVHLGYRFR